MSLYIKEQWPKSATDNHRRDACGIDNSRMRCGVAARQWNEHAPTRIDWRSRTLSNKYLPKASSELLPNQSISRAPSSSSTDPFHYIILGRASAFNIMLEPTNKDVKKLLYEYVPTYSTGSCHEMKRQMRANVVRSRDSWPTRSDN